MRKIDNIAFPRRLCATLFHGFGPKLAVAAFAIGALCGPVVAQASAPDNAVGFASGAPNEAMAILQAEANADSIVQAACEAVDGTVVDETETPQQTIYYYPSGWWAKASANAICDF